MHGVSMWNFNLDELKAEAAAIDNEVGGGDPSAKSSLQKKGSRFKIIEEENSGAGSDSGASTQNAKIEQKGRFTISDDTPAQQQEQQQPPQPQRKSPKKADSSSRKNTTSRLLLLKEAPAALVHQKSSKCAKKWSFSLDSKTMSFARSGKRTRAGGGESPSWADDRFFVATRRLNRRAKKTHTYARVRAHILHTTHTHTQREREKVICGYISYIIY